MFRTEYFLNLHEVNEDIELKFSETFKLMKQGAKVKLPGWNGYWCWDDEKQTIMIHCRPKDFDKGQGDVLESWIYGLLNETGRKSDIGKGFNETHP